MSEEKRIILVTCGICGYQNQLPDDTNYSTSKCSVCNDFFRIDPKLFSENRPKIISEAEQLKHDVNELIKPRDIDDAIKSSQDEIDEEFTPAELEEIELEIKKLVTPLTGKRSPDYDENLDPEKNELIPK